MKTTEIFVEQVLIGVVILLIGGVLLFGKGFLEKTDFNLSTGIIVIVAAYPMGIVYDRIADTLLGNLQAHHRLWFGFKQPSSDEGDVFPEARYRIAILKCNNATDHAAYLRSRIRLTRALTTLAPAMAVASLALFYEPAKNETWLRISTLLFVIAAYGLVLMVKLWKKSGRPPKTYDIAKHADYKGELVYDDEKGGPRDGYLGFLFRHEALLSCTFVLLPAIASIVWAFRSNNIALIVVPLAGVGLTLVIGWSWWRVSQTFMTFLDDFNQPPSS